ncbi:Heat shock protein HslJ [Vibrio stylophorae]|uniref:Heat shock protein HslJ n=1 Tax=Vibrio stylophorae TaxID=659351 RepID=A0ABM8ZU14_9VIBR|nr:META domain-containing protein [Vibrio stylophorae]CAH0533808.1 Heat shock protein HslJ [Vibrio stylophorae]
MKKSLLIGSIALGLVGCSTGSVTQQDLQHHRWILSSIDGVAVEVNKEQPADLEIGEHFTVGGNSGCNRYFGQGELENGKFRVDQMGSTMMLCPEAAMEVERAVTETLGDWSTVTVNATTLTLDGEHTLVFTLKDWVN